MSNPLVSVYCLAYNHEKYIRQTLEGFVNQNTNFEYEVFVHDDASTDNTPKIIKEYAEKYPNIIKPIFQKENKYSKGIRIAKTFIYPYVKGKYIAICEGDDYWCDDNKLQMQADYLESHKDYVACVHNSIMLNSITGEEKIMYNPKKDYDITFNDVIQGGSSCYQTASLMYRIELKDNRPEFFYKLTTCGDYQLSIYLALNGKIRFFNKVMSYYRVFSSECSWTKSNRNEKAIRKHNNELNQMFDSLNIYTNDKYKDTIELVRLRYDYLMHETLHNFDELKNKKYKGIWKDKDIRFKAARFAKKYFGETVATLQHHKYDVEKKNAE